MQLRSYQLRAIESARAARRKGHRRLLLSSPTGSGKTVIAIALLKRSLELGDSVLVIAHRLELISQFYSHLYRQGITAGVMRGTDERTDKDARIQLGTIQTLVRRELPEAALVVIDEAHRVPGDSYTRTLEAFPKATQIGLTATPSRLDGQPLAEHFDQLLQVASYSELITEGSILAPIVYAPRKSVDLSHVKKVAGDYHEGQLEEAMLQPHVVGDVVGTWLQRAEGRKTVCFAVGIEHSRELVSRFKAEGVRAAHLDGTTPEDERIQILHDLETGKLTLVSNVGVLCEGWDQPSVKCCIMARPTLSLTLWMQCSGRILRPYCKLCGGKCASSGEHPPYVPPMVLDHSGNVDRHGLPHEDREWSLDGIVKRQTSTLYHVCAGCYAYVQGTPCPLCGHLEVRKPREVRTAPGVLERINGNIEAERQADPKRVYFDQQAEKARKGGYKPGFAAAKYKEKFGQWPPWDWSQALKRAFETDQTWQEKVKYQSEKREHWQRIQEQREKETAAIPQVEEFESSGIDEL